MIRMIAFDLDGTLLNEEKQITQRTKESLEKAAREEIILVVATGRHLDGVTQSQDVMDLVGVRYIITSNGAQIYDRDTGECIYRDCIDLDRMISLVQRLDALRVMADPFVNGKAYMNKNKLPLIEKLQASEGTKRYISSSRTPVEDLGETLKLMGEGVEKLTINFAVDEDGARIDYDKVCQVLSDYPDMNPISGGMHNIEVTKKGVSKASGLSWLGEHLGILSDQMMAFGDSGNDLAMLQMVGYGVAMANAEEEVLEAVDHVTGSNEEDGIARALEVY